jgi:anthranilate/para-aminobenzoate synthase component I
LKNSIVETHEREVGLASSVASLCNQLGRQHAASLWLDGREGSEQAWSTGSLLAVQPRVSLTFPDPSSTTLEPALASLENIVRRRRRRGGTGATGVALMLSYEAFDEPRPAIGATGYVPRIVAMEIDRSLRPLDDGRYLLTQKLDDAGREGAIRSADEFVEHLAASANHGGALEAPPARVCGAVNSRLCREEYLRTVRRIKHHIECGDVYQANLCQHFSAPYRGDECQLFDELSRTISAPKAAFVRTPEFCIASVSPETFLRGRPDGHIETWPIKGTRSRHIDPVLDREAASELLASVKDRAELLMIVDLERNDLGRVCQVGSVSVRELASLQSFSTVHHLVACVEGRQRPDVGLSELLRATFPGGSISGAPKIRARQILDELEGSPRGFFTGVLCWLGDDGTMDSSILIRTLVFSTGRVHLGAGGGIVADSDPEQEWHESNLKARAPAAALGFAPEEAR